MNINERLNILVVHNYYKQRGGEDLIYEKEVDLLRKNGQNVVTYYRHNDEINTSWIIKLFFPFIVFFSFKTYFDIKRIIKLEKIDVVHIHNYMALISQSVYYAAKSVHVPVVQSIHNYRFVCPNALLYCNGSVCERCINVNIFQAMKNRCYKNSIIITLLVILSTLFHRMTRIHNYCNFICNTQFSKNKLLNDRTIVKEKIYIKNNFTNFDENYIVSQNRECAFVYAARLDENKGIKFLLNSWKEFKNINYKLYICGVGELEEWCKKYIASNDLNNVTMLGYISHEELLCLLSKCKALIYPTRWYEAMPIGVIDAFSVGTPVIGPNFGNVGEMVIDSINGYKYEVDNVKSLVDALCRVSRENIPYENIRSFFLENYSENENYLSLMRIYKNVLMN